MKQSSREGERGVVERQRLKEAAKCVQSCVDTSSQSTHTAARLLAFSWSCSWSSVYFVSIKTTRLLRDVGLDRDLSQRFDMDQ